MVRLLRDTRAALREWLTIQDTNFCRGRGEGLRGQQDGHVSLDAAIAELLRRDAKHRERAAKSRRKPRVETDDPIADMDDAVARMKATIDKIDQIGRLP